MVPTISISPSARVGTLAEGWRFELARPAHCLRLDGPGLITALADEGPNVAEGSWRRGSL